MHAAPSSPAPAAAPVSALADAPPRSQLALRRVAIDTWRENVAYLHRDCAVYRAEGFQALSKIKVRANGLPILATVNVVDDSAIVGGHELGLSEDSFAQLGVGPGYKVAVAQAGPPESMGALFRKIAGERLGRADFRAIVRDIIAAQGAKEFDHNSPNLGALQFEICAPTAGVVAGIDNQQIARIARLAGAPKVQGAGVDLLCKLGDAVTPGQRIYRVHAGFPADLEFPR